jgi:hypothetical protein
MQLTPNYVEMVVHYMAHRKKTAAYRHAFNPSDNCPRTTHRNAFEAFRHPLVAELIRQMEHQAMAKLAIDSAWVLKRAALLADFNLSSFVVTDVETGNAVYDFSEATDDDWYCISEYTLDKITKGTGGDTYDVERVKIKAHCKLRALELVGKHTTVQAFTERVEHTGVVGVAQLSVDEYKQARQDMLAHDDC